MRPEPPITDDELNRIEHHFYEGLYGDYEMRRLIEQLRVHRLVLKTLFGKFQREPLRRVCSTDPVRNSELSYLKERVAMEDGL